VDFFAPIDAQHFCLGTSTFSSDLLTPQRDVLFSDLVTACSIGYCSNHSHFGGVLCSYRRSALGSWYTYLLFSGMLSPQRNDAFLALMSACSLGFISAGFLHICHRLARLFQYKYLLFRNNYTTTDDMYFSVLLMARSLGYCCKLEALLSRYKYLLFRIAYTTAE
jgi:hypothetical protein